MQDFTRRRLVALLTAALPTFSLRPAKAETSSAPEQVSNVEQVDDYGNWRVVSIYNTSHAFIIPERLVGHNRAETADKSNFGSAQLDLEYWSVHGGSYTGTLGITTKADPLQPDLRHTVRVYLDDTPTGSFEATDSFTQDAIEIVGGLAALTAAHTLRVDMQIGDETLTILDLDLTGIADAVPAMKVIPDYNHNVLGLGQGLDQPIDPDAPTPSCFITTACCDLIGLPDDCWELRTLRQFRDKVMLPTEDGRADVARYYRLAPQILRAMHAARDERQLLDIYARYIMPSALAARLGLSRVARRLYTGMMMELTRRYLIP